MLKKTVTTCILVAFLSNTVLFPVQSFAQGVGMGLPYLPPVGAMVSLSPPYMPVMLKGLKLNPNNPLAFDFILDTGDTKLDKDALKEESTKLIKYFLASLTTPGKDLWVNLSPYEKDRVIPKDFGVTQMGQDLLAQDYILKQLTASLIYPENDLGKKFWEKIYKKAQELYGTTEIPVNTFNKVWIVPDKATIYVNNNTAFIVKSHMKVMLEEDYLALSQAPDQRPQTTDQKQVSTLSSQVIREVIIPEIEKEVNSGKNFANLRQITDAVILAAWYERNLKDNILSKVYSNQNKTSGIDSPDRDTKEKIYAQYLEAFKTGVYNYIKEDIDPQTKEATPRRYMAGGAVIDKTTIPIETTADFSVLADAIQNQDLIQAPTDITVVNNSTLQPKDVDSAVLAANPAPTSLLQLSSAQTEKLKTLIIKLSSIGPQQPKQFSFELSMALEIKRAIAECFAKGEPDHAVLIAVEAVKNNVPGITAADIKGWIADCFAKGEPGQAGTIAVEAIKNNIPGVTAEDVKRAMADCFAKGWQYQAGLIAVEAVKNNIPGVTAEDVKRAIAECFVQGWPGHAGLIAVKAVKNNVPGITAKDVKQAIAECFAKDLPGDAGTIAAEAIKNNIPSITAEDVKRWIAECFAKGWQYQAGLIAVEAVKNNISDITAADIKGWIADCFAKSRPYQAGTIAVEAIKNNIPGVTAEDVKRAMADCFAKGRPDEAGTIAVEAIKNNIPGVRTEDVKGWIADCFAKLQPGHAGLIAVEAVKNSIPGITATDIKGWIADCFAKSRPDQAGTIAVATLSENMQFSKEVNEIFLLLKSSKLFKDDGIYIASQIIAYAIEKNNLNVLEEILSSFLKNQHIIFFLNLLAKADDKEAVLADIFQDKGVERFIKLYDTIYPHLFANLLGEGLDLSDRRTSALLRAITHFDTSQFARSDLTFQEIYNEYEEDLRSKKIAALPKNIPPARTIEVATKKLSELTPDTKNYYREMMLSIEEAISVIDQAEDTPLYRNGLNTLITAITARQSDLTEKLKDTTLSQIAQENITKEITLWKGITAILASPDADIASLISLDVTRLKAFSNLKNITPVMRMLLFTYALKNNPQWQDYFKKNLQTPVSLEAITQMVSFADSFIKPHLLKGLEPQARAELLKYTNTRIFKGEINRLSQEKSEFTRKIKIIPMRGWLAEFIGYFSDECWTRTENIMRDNPEMMALVFFDEDKQELLGGTLLIQNSVNGEKVLIDRGLSPRIRVTAELNIESFVSQVTDYEAEIARSLGATKILVPLRGLELGLGSNNPDVIQYYERTLSGQKAVALDIPNDFNDHDITTGKCVVIRKVAAAKDNSVLADASRNKNLIKAPTKITAIDNSQQSQGDDSALLTSNEELADLTTNTNNPSILERLNKIVPLGHQGRETVEVLSKEGLMPVLGVNEDVRGKEPQAFIGKFIYDTKTKQVSKIVSAGRKDESGSVFETTVETENGSRITFNPLGDESMEIGSIAQIVFLKDREKGLVFENIDFENEIMKQMTIAAFYSQKINEAKNARTAFGRLLDRASPQWAEKSEDFKKKLDAMAQAIQDLKVGMLIQEIGLKNMAFDSIGFNIELINGGGIKIIENIRNIESVAVEIDTDGRLRFKASAQSQYNRHMVRFSLNRTIFSAMVDSFKREWTPDDFKNAVRPVQSYEAMKQECDLLEMFYMEDLILDQNPVERVEIANKLKKLYQLRLWAMALEILADGILPFSDAKTLEITEDGLVVGFENGEKEKKGLNQLANWFLEKMPLMENKKQIMAMEFLAFYQEKFLEPIIRQNEYFEKKLTDLRRRTAGKEIVVVVAGKTIHPIGETGEIIKKLQEEYGFLNERISKVLFGEAIKRADPQEMETADQENLLNERFLRVFMKAAVPLVALYAVSPLLISLGHDVSDYMGDHWDGDQESAFDIMNRSASVDSLPAFFYAVYDSNHGLSHKVDSVKSLVDTLKVDSVLTKADTLQTDLDLPAVDTLKTEKDSLVAVQQDSLKTEGSSVQEINVDGEMGDSPAEENSQFVPNNEDESGNESQKKTLAGFGSWEIDSPGEERKDTLFQYDPPEGDFFAASGRQDNFDGRYWVSSGKDFHEAIKVVPTGEKKNFVKKVSGKVLPLYVLGNSQPDLKSIRVSDEATFKIVISDGSILLRFEEKSHNRTVSYNVPITEPQDKTARHLKGVPEDFIKHYTQMPYPIDWGALKEFDLKGYLEHVKSLPMSERLRQIEPIIDLMQKYIKYPNTGDEQIAKQLAQDNMSYGHKMIEGLLTGKKTDCTGFATLVAMFLREAGIPAELSIGYKDVDGSGIISSSNGHAVVAVYYNYAWHIFDVTPAMQGGGSKKKEDAQLSKLFSPPQIEEINKEVSQQKAALRKFSPLAGNIFSALRNNDKDKMLQNIDPYLEKIKEALDVFEQSSYVDFWDLQSLNMQVLNFDLRQAAEKTGAVEKLKESKIFERMARLNFDFIEKDKIIILERGGLKVSQLSAKEKRIINYNFLSDNLIRCAEAVSYYAQDGIHIDYHANYHWNIEDYVDFFKRLKDNAHVISGLDFPQNNGLNSIFQAIEDSSGNQQAIEQAKQTILKYIGEIIDIKGNELLKIKDDQEKVQALIDFGSLFTGAIRNQYDLVNKKTEFFLKQDLDVSVLNLPALDLYFKLFRGLYDTGIIEVDGRTYNNYQVPTLLRQGQGGHYADIPQTEKNVLELWKQHMRGIAILRMQPGLAGFNPWDKESMSEEERDTTIIQTEDYYKQFKSQESKLGIIQYFLERNNELIKNVPSTDQKIPASLKMDDMFFVDQAKKIGDLFRELNDPQIRAQAANSTTQQADTVLNQKDISDQEWLYYTTLVSLSTKYADDVELRNKVMLEVLDIAAQRIEKKSEGTADKLEDTTGKLRDLRYLTRLFYDSDADSAGAAVPDYYPILFKKKAEILLSRKFAPSNLAEFNTLQIKAYFELLSEIYPWVWDEKGTPPMMMAILSPYATADTVGKITAEEELALQLWERDMDILAYFRLSSREATMGSGLGDDYADGISDFRSRAEQLAYYVESFYKAFAGQEAKEKIIRYLLQRNIVIAKQIKPRPLKQIVTNVHEGWSNAIDFLSWQVSAIGELLDGMDNPQGQSGMATETLQKSVEALNQKAISREERIYYAQLATRCVKYVTDSQLRNKAIQVLGSMIGNNKDEEVVFEVATALLEFHDRPTLLWTIQTLSPQIKALSGTWFYKKGKFIDKLFSSVVVDRFDIGQVIGDDLTQEILELGKERFLKQFGEIDKLSDVEKVEKAKICLSLLDPQDDGTLLKINRMELADFLLKVAGHLKLSLSAQELGDLRFKTDGLITEYYTANGALTNTMPVLEKDATQYQNLTNKVRGNLEIVGRLLILSDILNISKNMSSFEEGVRLTKEKGLTLQDLEIFDRILTEPPLEKKQLERIRMTSTPAYLKIIERENKKETVKKLTREELNILRSFIIHHLNYNDVPLNDKRNKDGATLLKSPSEIDVNYPEIANDIEGVRIFLSQMSQESFEQELRMWNTRQGGVKLTDEQIQEIIAAAPDERHKALQDAGLSLAQIALLGNGGLPAQPEKDISKKGNVDIDTTKFANDNGWISKPEYLMWLLKNRDLIRGTIGREEKIKVYYYGMGGGISPQTGRTQKIDIISPLLATDFDTLIAYDIAKISSGFQDKLTEELSAIKGLQPEDIHVELLGGDQGYVVTFPYQGRIREIRAFYAKSAIKEYPADLENGYHVLYSRGWPAGIRDMDTSIKQKLLDHLIPEKSFVVLENFVNAPNLPSGFDKVDLGNTSWAGEARKLDVFLKGNAKSDESPVASLASPAKKKGGIDLNPENIDLDVQGEKANLNLPIDLKELENMQIDGFTPVIINIIPITNLPLLLGATETVPAHPQELSANEFAILPKS